MCEEEDVVHRSNEASTIAAGRASIAEKGEQQPPSEVATAIVAHTGDDHPNHLRRRGQRIFHIDGAKGPTPTKEYCTIATMRD